MKNKLQKQFILPILLSVFWLILSVKPASADAGIAPPAMHFSIEYKIQPAYIIEAHLLLCEDRQCAHYQIFEVADYFFYMLPSFYCGGENNSEWCYAGLGNGKFGKYYRISILFDDGVTRISNVFKKRGYTSYYTLVVNDVDLLIQEKVAQNWLLYNLFSPFQVVCFLPSALITMITEVQVAKRYAKKIQKPIRHIVLANLISLPIVWFILPSWLKVNYLWVLIMVELFAIIFEAVFILYTNRASKLSLREGIITSVIINLASFVLGGFLLCFVLFHVY
jgi:uncharacterized membrane protein YagU involved in acid resistance